MPPYKLTPYIFTHKLAPAINLPFETGATKGVFIPPNADFVIKIPFSGLDNKYPFTRSPSHTPWNYLEAEMDIQKRAEYAGVGQCFAKLTPARTNFPIYIQQKVLMADNHYVNTGTAAINAVDNDFDLEWQAAAYEWYGKTFYDSLLTFLRKSHIEEDLHSSNLGYDPLTKQPLIVDWGGYWES